MTRERALISNGLIIAALAIALLWGTTLFRQHQQFARGETALVLGDFPAAVAGYEATIHRYTPGSPLVGRAAEQLWALALQYEQRGNRERALIAYRSLRSAFYATGGPASSGREWISRCDQRIAALTGKEHHEQQHNGQ